jgi:hypothetical protein
LGIFSCPLSTTHLRPTEIFTTVHPCHVMLSVKRLQKIKTRKELLI